MLLGEQEAWKRWLHKNGLLKDAPLFIERKKKLFQGLLFCNQADARQLQMAHEILQSSKYDAQWELIGWQFVNFSAFIDKYLMKVWFNPNSVHFAGKSSNFFVDIESEATPQLTNNPMESLNKTIKSLFKVGFINKKAFAKGMLQFYRLKHRHLNGFLNGE